MNKINFEYKFESILIIFIPIFLVFSRFLLEFSLLIITTSFLFIAIKRNEISFFKNRFSKLFLLFFLILLSSYFLSEFKIETITILFYFRFYLYVLALSFFLKKEKNLINYFIYSFIIVTLILIADSILQFYSGKNILGYSNAELHRITSFFDDEQILGSFIAKIFPILIFAKILIEPIKKKIHLILNITLISSPICIILSGERSGLLLFSIMIFYYLFFFFREKKFNFYYYSIFFLTIFAVIFLFSSKTYYDRYITQTLSSIFDKDYSQNRDLIPNDMKNKYNFYFLSAQHQNYMNTSLKIFNQNKIFGSGPKSYRHSCARDDININYYSCGTHPHNYYFQFLSELGLLGFLFIVLVYFYIIIKSLINYYNLIVKKKYNISEIIILGYYFAQLWPITQTGNFFNNYNSILFFIPLSFYMFIKLKKNNNAL